MEKETYLKALDRIEEICEEKHFSEHIETVYLSGSVARGDFVPGRSDIDLYIVLDERDENIENSFRQQMNEVVDEYLQELKKYDPDGVSTAFTSLEEIENEETFLGAGAEYQNFIESAELLYGEDLKDEIPEPTKDEVNKSIEHYFDMMEVKYEQMRPQHTRKLFSSIFRTLSMLLTERGIHVSSKEKIVEKFEQAFEGRKELKEDLEEAYRLWELWGGRDLTQDEFCTLSKKCEKIISSIFELRNHE